jgi:hypothetical protein
MFAQVLLAPDLAVLNVSTGLTPGRLFQIATNRSTGQAAASCASSFSLEGFVRGGNRSGGFFLSSKRANAVFDANGENHFESPLFRFLCGHDINQSEMPRKQAIKDINLWGERLAMAMLRDRQMIPGENR